MVRIQVFDPPMCCPTGVCGPAVDPGLVRFAADLDWVRSQGVAVERFNLAQQPLAFAQDPEVQAALQAEGEKALPLVRVGDQVRSKGRHPSREELAAWAGLGIPEPSLFTEAVQELVAIAAAIASNCESCFKFHYDKARRLGVSREDMLRAVRTAQSVKEAPARSVLGVAERYLTQPSRSRIEASDLGTLPATPPSGDCAGPGSCC